ncbi:MAG: DUF4129 domain-containing protein [Carbonactinosporaceae bacterium]
MLPLDVPVDVPRDEARDAARRELSNPIYHQDDPNPFQQGVQWVLERLNELLSDVAGSHTAGYVGLAVLALLLVVTVTAVRLKVGPLARRGAAERSLFTAPALSAAEHRERADRLRVQGRWAEAVRERLRAIIRDLEQRGLLDPEPGRTADEAASEAGRILPGYVAELRAAARIFDDVWYGAREATPDMEDRLRDLDARVRRARPTAVGAGSPR